MDNNTDNKLSKNITRVAAGSALRHIHKLIDSFEYHERKNRRVAGVVLALVLLMLVSISIYIWVQSGSETIILNNKPGHSDITP